LGEFLQHLLENQMMHCELSGKAYLHNKGLEYFVRVLITNKDKPVHLGAAQS
jgi:hypothetical protein